MKNTKLVVLIQAGLALSLMAPRVTLGEDFDASLAAIQNELARTRGTGANATTDAESKKIIDALKANKEISDAVAKKNRWDDITNQYKAIEKRGESRLKGELEERLGKADSDIRAAKSIQSQAGQMAGAVSGELESTQLPAECRFGVDFSSARTKLTNLDQAAVNAKTNLTEFAKQDKEKARKEFKKSLALEFAKMMKSSGAEDNSGQLVEKLQQLASAMMNPTIFVQLAKNQLKDSKAAAKAAEASARIFFMDPENGLLARLDKLKESDDSVAEVAIANAQHIRTEGNQMADQLRLSINEQVKNCELNKQKLTLAKKQSARGMEIMSDQFSKTSFDSEQARFVKDLDSISCDATQALTGVEDLRAQVNNQAAQIEAQTKSPRGLREAIVNGLRIVPEKTLELAKMIRPLNESCAFAANAVKKANEDPTRAEVIAAGKSGQHPQLNQVAGQPSQQRRGLPTGAPSMNPASSTHNGI